MTIASHAGEEYLRTIYEIENNDGRVLTTQLSRVLGVRPASATAMIKKLAEKGLINHQPYQGVTLTRAGRNAALNLLRRHRLVETFLSVTLSVPWSRLHEEAHRIEHALSDYLIERIDELLGSPTHNPHGAPIPTADGEITEPNFLRLSELEIGQKAIVAQVDDLDPELLSYLNQLGILPGVYITILNVAPFNGPITVLSDNIEKSIGREVCQRVKVNPDWGAQEGKI